MNLTRASVLNISLKMGEHSIAVKVVDNDGLENTEVVKLKVNGVVEKIII
jgi:hypothetical protein